MTSHVHTVNLEYQKAKGDRPTFFNYTASKKFCNEIGLEWRGDDFIAEVDKDAWLHSFTQLQVDMAMRHHLWWVKFLFTPRTYTGWQRILMALHFLFGKAPE